ncbi:MAG: PaaI family thioesterase [Bacteroidota bacterium]
MLNKERNVEHFNSIGKGHFPDLLGIRVTHIEEGKLHGEMPVKAALFAPNGYLHAGSIITFADTIAGYSTMAHLPEKARSFTTIELKSNFLGAKKDGKLHCECIAEHLGRTTHVWRAIVKDPDTGKKIALFSCTQLIIY